MTQTVGFGPRLAARPTGTLRSALMVMPSRAIQDARPLPGEPNALHARALAQAEILERTLRYFGCDVITAQAPAEDPYAAAVAQCAIVFENGVVVMRPAVPARRAAALALEKALESHDVPVAGHVAAPALLDGSDVLLAGTTAFVGAGMRSNALGRTGFSEIARAHGFTVREVRLGTNVESLRSVAGIVSASAVVLAPPGRVDHAAFEDFTIVQTPPSDELGAGVLNLGDNHVLADMRFPAVADLLRKRGVTVEAIDLYDFGRVGITPSMLVLDLKRA
jgi:dimethylargininase